MKLSQGIIGVVAATCICLVWLLAKNNSYIALGAGAATSNAANVPRHLGDSLLPGRFCSPATVPLASRVSFPQYALKLREHMDAHVSSSDPVRRQRPFRAVEIGSLFCGNVFSFRTVINMFAPADLAIEYFAVDSWGYRGEEPGVQDMNDEARGLRMYGYCQGMLNATFPDTRLIRRLSVDAASLFDDGFFDFVYIDALHTYGAAKADMDAWWPKLREGGLFAGDDFGDEQIAPLWPWDGDLYRDFKWGVIQAVEEFASSHKISVHTTNHEFKMHPAISAMIPKHIPLPEKLHLGSYRGIPNWYAVKPHRLFDGTCVEVLVKHGWIRELDHRLPTIEATNKKKRSNKK